MHKPLLISLAAATILTTSLSAQSMYDRIQEMEIKMKQMQKEITTLKSSDDEAVEEKDAVSEDDASENDDEDSASKDDDSQDEESASEDEESEDDEMTVEERIEELDESIFELNKMTNGNKLKLGVDYRFALDNMQYKMADGSEQGNDAFMTNRLWINMDWKATDNLSFSGQIAYNKAFGARSGANNPQSGSQETFDWVTNENAYDGVLRIRSAYFLYKNDTFLGTEVPWTFSIGRRPSTNGHIINLRDDDGAASPLGHSINVEFDGLSSKFAFDELTGIDGMYIKFCAGRGMTNASPKFSSAPYDGAADGPQSNPDIDLGGLIFVPYDNGHYAVHSQYYYASNLIEAINPQDQTQGFDTVGGMHSLTADFTANGIGNEWSDYLDDTFFFVSASMSVTNPEEDQGMLGSDIGESVTGYSVWTGLQMPSFMTDDGRWGVEYNKGSKYWRSITYAEDTNVGSKMAVRGDAYEVYFTEPLVEDILTLQVRYTYLDYKYAGSNGFFGNTSGNSALISDAMPGAANYVDVAQDIRFYLRYRY